MPLRGGRTPQEEGMPMQGPERKCWAGERERVRKEGVS